jgi:alpha-beta hydrolase superfamily lysophospholipase
VPINIQAPGFGAPTGFDIIPAMPELIGTEVLYRRWKPRPQGAPAKAAFLLVHGLGAQSARWAFLAEYLAGAGFASYAPELRGYGLTPERPRGHVASLRVWERDVLALRETAAAENPGRKVFILGESVGGLIAFNAAGRQPAAFDGLVLISPDFKNGLKFPFSSYLTLAALILFQPKRTIPIPYTSAMCTRDAAYQAVLDADPGELRIGSLAVLMSIRREQGESRKLAARLRIPALFLLSGTDYLVDEQAGRRLFAKLPAPDKSIIEYPKMLHALSIDLGREKVFRDILDWTQPRI